MAEERITTLGHILAYDTSLELTGLKYLLHELSDDERKVFFDQAFSHGQALFEDHFSHKYTLTHTDFGYRLTQA